MSLKLSRHPILLITTAGFLLGVSQLFHSLWSLSFFALALFIFACNNQTFFSYTKTKAFFSGSLFGFIYTGTTLIWFFETHPLDWLIDNLWVSFGAILLSWLTAVIGLTIPFGLLSLFFHQTTKLKKYQLWFFPVVWVLVEYISMWTFAVLTYAPDSLLGAHFSVGMVGYLLGSHSLLLQLASLGGAYLLSLVTIFISVVLYQIFKHYSFAKKNLFIVGGIFLAMVWATDLAGDYFLNNATNQNAREVKVALFSAYKKTKGYEHPSADSRYKNYKQLLTANQEQLNQADLIVFPENADVTKRLIKDTETDILSTISSTTVFIDSGFRKKTGIKSSATIYLFDKTTGLREVYEKTFLVPSGEYTYWLFDFVFTLMGKNKQLDEIEVKKGLSEKGNLNIEEETNGLYLKSRFCSEILSPQLYRVDSDEQKDKTILINTASHSYFHSSTILYNQIINLAKVHAVTNRAPFIQSTHGAPAFVIDQYGKITAESTRNQDSILFSSIYIKE